MLNEEVFYTQNNSSEFSKNYFISDGSIGLLKIKIDSTSECDDFSGYPYVKDDDVELFFVKYKDLSSLENIKSKKLRGFLIKEINDRLTDKEPQKYKYKKSDNSLVKLLYMYNGYHETKMIYDTNQKVASFAIKNENKDIIINILNSINWENEDLNKMRSIIMHNKNKTKCKNLYLLDLIAKSSREKDILLTVINIIIKVKSASLFLIPKMLQLKNKSNKFILSDELFYTIIKSNEDLFQNVITERNKKRTRIIKDHELKLRMLKFEDLSDVYIHQLVNDKNEDISREAMNNFYQFSS